MNRPTQALIEHATEGNQPSIDELMQRYLPELQAFVRLNMGAALQARESSSDLVQSACREVLEDLSEFEYRGEKAFKRLLFLQAQRKLASRGRFHGRQQRALNKEQPLDSDAIAAGAMHLLTPSREASGKEEVARFFEAIDSLPEEQRKVLLLCRGLGMTPTEAADEVGKTANNVRVTLHRALARFAVVQEQLELDGRN